MVLLWEGSMWDLTKRGRKKSENQIAGVESYQGGRSSGVWGMRDPEKHIWYY